MTRVFQRILAAAAALGAFAPVPSAAHEPRDAARVAWISEMADAARTWLASLGDRPEARVAFAEEERRNWHYVPRSRRGVALRDMTEAQRGAATALVRASLSARGLARVEGTRALEAVLATAERSSRRFRDPDDYAFTVFGTPGEPPWAWRVEGHHLSVNVTVAAAGHAAVTPLFSGSHPARRPAGPHAGERLHGAEHALALDLARSLTERQWAAARIGDRSLGDVVAGPGRPDALATPQGLAHADLTATQRATLWALIEAYVGLARDEFGRPYLALVREGLPATRFAWAGGRAEGTAFYYRIHGPRVLIEFDDTQNDANHVHSLWRDPANDFGRDDLREHYGARPHGGGGAGR